MVRGDDIDAGQFVVRRREPTMASLDPVGGGLVKAWMSAMVVRGGLSFVELPGRYKARTPVGQELVECHIEKQTKEEADARAYDLSALM